MFLLHRRGVRCFGRTRYLLNPLPMSCRIENTELGGWRAVRLSDGLIEVTVLPDKGTHIDGLTDRASSIDEFRRVKNRKPFGGSRAAPLEGPCGITPEPWAARSYLADAVAAGDALSLEGDGTFSITLHATQRHTRLA